MTKLEEIAGSILPADAALFAQASRRLDSLTKPPGSLGRLEDLARRISASTGKPRPRFKSKAVFCFASDHGIAAEGVSAYPAEVTAQMVENFLAGGAAINVLARHAGARVVIADLGVASDLPPRPGLISEKIARGTGNFTREPAMSPEEAVRAVEAGVRIAEAEAERGADLFATGEMGIGNTASAAAITAVMAGIDPDEATGYGTGISDEQRARKAGLIRSALKLHRPDPAHPLDVLAKVGGFEIGGLAGVMLAGGARRIPIIVDGFISGAAALIACAVAPALKDHLIAAHLSAERGHAAALKRLGLNPLLSLDLRLGEGTGAALAINLVEAACRIMEEMATFESAGVSSRRDD